MLKEVEAVLLLELIKVIIQKITKNLTEEVIIIHCNMPTAK